MKIAIIGQKGIPATWGGVEQHVHHLVRNLATLNHQEDVELLVYARSHYASREAAAAFEKEHPGVRIVFTPSVVSKHFDAITHTLTSTLHALWNGADIFHFQMVGPSLLSWIPRLFRPRARVITTFHSPDRLHQKWGWFARTMLTIGEWTAVHFSHAPIVISRYLQNYAEERYFVNTTYIPNGVPVAQRQQPSMITAEFGLEGNDYILVVSRLIRHKGIHYLIDAYTQLDTDKKLVIVGDESYTSDYVAELKEQAGDNENIVFTGFQTGRILEELYTNAYLYVQPSESEGLSIAVLEAASYGNAIIASDIPANMEVVYHGGLSFRTKDIDDLAHKLTQLLQDPILVEAMGRKLRQHVAEHYDWKHIAEQTADLYYKELNMERTAGSTTLTTQ